jgi:hypothetical protein
MSSHSQARLVARTQRAVVDLFGLDLSTLPNASLLDLARRLRTVACQIQALEVEAVGEIDARGATADSGSGSTASWLRTELRVGDALLRVRCARVLTRTELLPTAFAAGELSLEHVGVVARLSARGCDVTSPIVERDLVERARTQTPNEFARAAAIVCQPVAPTSSRSPNRTSSGWLRSRRLGDHTVALSARFDRAAGDELLAAIDSVAGSGCDQEHVPASIRRANALLVICRLAARSERVGGPEAVREADRSVGGYGRAASRAEARGKRRSSRPSVRTARRRVGRRSHR